MNLELEPSQYVRRSGRPSKPPAHRYKRPRVRVWLPSAQGRPTQRLPAGPYRLERMVVYFRTFHHDVIVLTYAASYEDDYTINELRRNLVENRPVYIRYGRDPSGMTGLVGHVHHQQLYRGEDRHNRLDVYVIGPSYRFQEPERRQWRDWPIMRVPHMIARNHFFSSVVSNSVTKKPASNQFPGSSWQAITNLAQKNGCVSYAKNTRLFFLRRTVEDVMKYRKVLTFTRRSSFGARSRQGFDNEIFSFERTEGPVVPHHGHAVWRQSYGINPRTKTVMKARGMRRGLIADPMNPAPAAFRREMQFNTATDLGSLREDILNAEQKEESSVVKAKISLRGDSRLAQGQVIFLAGLGDLESGYWLVTAVEHEFDFEEDSPTYRMRAEIERGYRALTLRPPLPDETIHDIPKNPEDPIEAHPQSRLVTTAPDQLIQIPEGFQGDPEPRVIRGDIEVELPVGIPPVNLGRFRSGAIFRTEWRATQVFALADGGERG